jgi:hypothetical protein
MRPKIPIKCQTEDCDHWFEHSEGFLELDGWNGSGERCRRCNTFNEWTREDIRWAWIKREFERMDQRLDDIHDWIRDRE